MSLGRGLESLIPPQTGNSSGGNNSSGNNNSPDNGDKADEKARELTAQNIQNNDLNQPAENQLFSAPVAPDSAAPAIIAPAPIIPAAANESVNPDSGPKIAQQPAPLVVPVGDKVGDKKLFKEAIFHVELSKIKPNPHQPRRDFDEESLKELAVSIREFGILQPLVVSKIEKETEFGSDVEYQLIAGERRWRAAKLLGLERVPVIIKNIVKDAERLEMAIVENLQRSDLNPIETARAYAKLQDVFGLTQREVASRLGKSRETVANSLRLLNLPKEIQDALAQGKINESQARLLLTIDEAPTQKALLEDLLNNNLSVRELRGRIKKTSPSSNRQNDFAAGHGMLKAVDPEILNLQEQLTELLGAQVKIEILRQARDKKGGKIIIDFYSPEEIQGIIQKLDNRGGQNQNQNQINL